MRAPMRLSPSIPVASLAVWDEEKGRLPFESRRPCRCLRGSRRHRDQPPYPRFSLPETVIAGDRTPVLPVVLSNYPKR